MCPRRVALVVPDAQEIRPQALRVPLHRVTEHRQVSLSDRPQVRDDSGVAQPEVRVRGSAAHD